LAAANPKGAGFALAHPLDDPAAEIDSLASLYNELGGSGWTNDANWLVGDPCANNWYGVTCSGASVISISLPNNNLSGYIDAVDLAGLTGLRRLHLPFNRIVGDIAGLDLTHNAALQYISLQSNQIGGGIEGLNLAQNSALEWLSLDNNQIVGDIAGFNLTQNIALQHVSLLDNQVGGNIDGLNLTYNTALGYLALPSNQMGGDIAGLDLTHNPNLWLLWLNDNHYISGDIANLDLSGNPNLAHIRLSDNQLTGNPGQMDFSRLPNLQTFTLSNNLVDGTVPDLVATHINDPNFNELHLCGSTNVVRPSGNPTIDGLAETYDRTGWTATYGCGGMLAASVVCSNGNLDVTIDQGDGPFDVTGVSGSSLPLSGVGIGTVSLVGPNTWTGLTITELGGDGEQLLLGDFTCSPSTQLTASAACQGADLAITISGGDTPLNIGGVGPSLPQTDVGVGATTLTGPGAWVGLTVAEAAGDGEQLQLGDFICSQPIIPVINNISSPFMLDPVINMSSSPVSAGVGDMVTFTIAVSNPHPQPIDNIVVTNPVSPDFDVLNVATTMGTSAVFGQIVTANLGVLQPGEQAIITIDTRSNAMAQPGSICNTASAGAVYVEGCVTLVPSRSQTAGRPVQTILGGLAVISLGMAVIGGAVVWWRSAS
jgi:uncharacterized repeat protein (TIGR01451 family)